MNQFNTALSNGIGTKRLLGAGLLAAAFALSPVAIEIGGMQMGATAAYAANGQGKGAEQREARAESKREARSESAASELGETAPGSDRSSNDHGKTASSLGRLNAAHASEHALANANSQSAVGKISLYRDAALVSAGAAETARLKEQLMLEIKVVFDAIDFDAIAEDLENASLAVTGSETRVEDAKAALVSATSELKAAEIDLVAAKALSESTEAELAALEQTVAEAEKALAEAESLKEATAGIEDPTEEQLQAMLDAEAAYTLSRDTLAAEQEKLTAATEADADAVLALADAEQEVVTATQTLDTADLELEVANGELEDSQRSLADAEQVIAEAEVVRDDFELATAESELAAAELDAAAALEDDALRTAANKSVDDEQGNVLTVIRDAVNSLLSIGDWRTEI